MNEGVRELGGERLFAGELQRMVAAFSIAWLAAANLVGVWLAVLLVRPVWGAFLGEWTYGRWAALHLNWQLYGWCSLPVVGLLLKRYLSPDRSGLRQAHGALSLWSFALVLGGVSWLQGETSGKLFLDWAGLPRLIFIATLVLLWCVLAANVFRHMVSTDSHASRRGRLIDQILLTVLVLVPIVLYWSAGRKVYPAFDPGTGGPTGASLLGSTLVVVSVIALLPKLLGLPRKPGYTERVFWVWFGIDAGIFLLIHHGNSSHRQWQQIAGLSSLLVWVPMLSWHLRRFTWNPPSRPWLHAVCWWWGALVISGFASFLPGFLDRIKFTHALVAHAHLAMAGLLTSVNMLVLLNLSVPSARAVLPLLDRGAFLCWHGGLLLQIAALSELTFIEVSDPGRLFSSGDLQGYSLRLLAGLLMAGASLYWATGVLKIQNPSEERLSAT